MASRVYPACDRKGRRRNGGGRAAGRAAAATAGAGSEQCVRQGRAALVVDMLHEYSYLARIVTSFWHLFRYARLQHQTGRISTVPVHIIPYIHFYLYHRANRINSRPSVHLHAVCGPMRRATKANALTPRYLRATFFCDRSIIRSIYIYDARSRTRIYRVAKEREAAPLATLFAFGSTAPTTCCIVVL